MNLQPSKTLLNKKHDWPVCQTLQCRWRGSWRNYHHEPRQGDNPPTWNQPPAKAPSGSSGRQRAREKMADKEFFLSLLSSAATKRDAKAYLSRFPSIKKSHALSTSIGNTPAAESQAFKEIEKPGVNLGSFYGAARSVHETPVFRQGAALDTDMHSLGLDESIHVALVKLVGAQSLNDETIKGVALTLSQLARLGMASCVVIDPEPVADEQDAKKVAIEQADRLSAAVDACDGGRARRLDSALVKTKSEELPKLMSREILLRPLRKSHIVILAPVAYSEQTTKAISVSSNEVMLALTRELAGLERRHDPDEDPRITAEQFAILQKEVVVDRLIVLDPVGGIPAFKGPQQSHVFVNMEQEFKLIEDELNEEMRSVQAATTSNADSRTLEEQRGILNATPRITTPSPQEEQGSTPEPSDKINIESLEQHLENLRLLNQTLSLLPPSSSAIISTPSGVANSARPQQDILAVSQVGTRRQKNPLIHNLLTDKPVFSSSLPSERRGQISPYIVQSTFLKRGMPLTLLPDPRIAPWSPDNPHSRRLSLNDPRIDLSRLVHLIEDSFNRKLDVQDYLNRIEGKLAGLIIAGEYEGGAILTWESPPDVPDQLRNDPENINRLVPYLDKFAVLKRSQGAGGVADIVFNAMLRTCLPNGVCWRSRKDNPVNKWYFERSRGTWKLSESNWAMFWTTPGVPEDEPLKFKDYEAVCRSIQPSWSDKKSTVD